jgi:hypothetical protein
VCLLRVVGEGEISLSSVESQEGMSCERGEEAAKQQVLIFHGGEVLSNP